MKVAFLIRSLERGGAERQLTCLARGLKKAGIEVDVAVFYGGGALEADLLSAGVSVTDLQKKSRWDIAGFLWRTAHWLRGSNADVLHTYLTGANLLGAVLKPVMHKSALVWGVRASNMALEKYDSLARIVFRLSCWISRRADLIIVNSEQGRDYHVSQGYPAGKMAVIFNGIDTNRFKPDPRARAEQRAAWKVEEDALLVGLVGRLDPMKDHKNFIRAAAQVRGGAGGNVEFVCVGDGAAEQREALKQFAGMLGLGAHVRWEAGREDMTNIYNALDVAASASAFGEGFSNVLAEAMACGVPCVATDVGDAREIIGKTGLVVPASDSRALAAAIVELLRRPERECGKLGAQARQRIVERFGTDRLVGNTLSVLRNLPRISPTKAA